MQELSPSILQEGLKLVRGLDGVRGPLKDLSKNSSSPSINEDFLESVSAVLGTASQEKMKDHAVLWRSFFQKVLLKDSTVRFKVPQTSFSLLQDSAENVQGTLLDALVVAMRHLKEPIPLLSGQYKLPSGIQFLMEDLMEKDPDQVASYVLGENHLKLSFFSAFGQFPPTINEDYAVLRKVAQSGALREWTYFLKQINPLGRPQGSGTQVFEKNTAFSKTWSSPDHYSSS